jgi:cell wall-associated NlpC family hydrolase
VAHESLKGQIEGVRFVPGQLMQVGVPVAGLFMEPKTSLARQMMFGEGFLVLENDPETDYSYGQCVFDDYVGYIKSDELMATYVATHKVKRLNTHIYPEADMKSVPLMTLPMGALLDVVCVKGGFGALATGGFIPAQAIGVLDDYAEDMVSVAEEFMGTAYLWGGDSYQGIDCSGLVQTSLRNCGQVCPRDSDIQQAEVGTEFGDNTPLRRGDLVFWKSHVGIMMDETMLLHANAHHMRVITEPLADVAARILKAEGLEIACRRRLNQ